MGLIALVFVIPPVAFTGLLLKKSFSWQQSDWLMADMGNNWQLRQNIWGWNIFCQRAKTLVLRKCIFFPLIHSVNKILFIRNIKAVSSENFIFESLYLFCWQKFLSTDSNHCINKFLFVNHDLLFWQIHSIILCFILCREYISQTPILIF